MKATILKAALICYLSVSTISSNVVAQVYGKGIIGLGNHNTEIDHIGYFGETEVFSMTIPNSFGGLSYRLYSYKDKKKVAQEEMVVVYNGKKYVPEGFVMKSDKLLAFFIASDASESVTSLFMQEFSENLKTVGVATKIEDLPYAMDGGKFKQSYGTSLFAKDPVKHQSLEFLHNTETGAIIFTFSLKYDDGKIKTSYAKSIVLNDKLEKVLVQDYKAKSPVLILKTRLKKIYPNNDAFFTIDEGESTSGKFLISRSAMVFVPGDGSELIELDLESDQEVIRSVVASHEISRDGLYYYAIHSNKEKSDYGYTGIYSFNPKSKETKRTTAKLGGQVTLPKPSDIKDYVLSKMNVLPDNSLVLEFNGYDSGNIVMKTSMDGNVKWATVSRAAVKGFAYVRDVLTCVVDNSYISIFNVHPAMLKGSSINMEKVGGIDLGSVPCVSKIDLETGKSSFSLLDGKGNTLGAINFLGSRTRTNGEFQLRMKFNGKVQTVPVTFN